MYDNILDEIRDLEYILREWEADDVFSGDQNYQRMLERLRELKEQYYEESD